MDPGLAEIAGSGASFPWLSLIVLLPAATALILPFVPAKDGEPSPAPRNITLAVLLADLLFQRPPGLLAALVVMGTEYLRIRFAGLRDASFAGEWIAVCVMIAAITLANRLTLSVVASTLPALAPSVIQMVLTMAFYPVAVLLSQSLLGVRKPDPRQAETLGAGA